MRAVSPGEHRTAKTCDVDLVTVAGHQGDGLPALKLSENLIADGGVTREYQRGGVHRLLEPLPHGFKILDLGSFHLSVPPAVGAADGTGSPGHAKANSLPGRGLGAARLWRMLKRANRRLEDSWLGDLIGALSLFVSLYMLLVIGWALQ